MHGWRLPGSDRRICRVAGGQRRDQAPSRVHRRPSRRQQTITRIKRRRRSRETRRRSRAHSAAPWRRRHSRTSLWQRLCSAFSVMSANPLLRILGSPRSANHLRRWITLWPPFLGAGLRITRIASDMKSIAVEMKLRFWNANYVGTHFGGSLFAMTDAFYMLMLMHHLGRDYIVWDKAATIRYKKPGRGPVRAEIHLTDAQVEKISGKLETLQKHKLVFDVDVQDQSGGANAPDDKLLNIR